MGKPTRGHALVPATECIGGVEGTRGSETSQYPQEEKTNSDSVSSGERKRMRLNHGCVIAGGRCIRGVVGSIVSILPGWPTVRNRCVRRSGLERPVVEGENPVAENVTTVDMDTQVAAGP